MKVHEQLRKTQARTWPSSGGITAEALNARTPSNTQHLGGTVPLTEWWSCQIVWADARAVRLPAMGAASAQTDSYMPIQLRAIMATMASGVLIWGAFTHGSYTRLGVLGLCETAEGWHEF